MHFMTANSQREGDRAGRVRFKEKIPSGIDLQFPMDFGIWQDFENFYKEI
jgi:hypothetical protein